ncbi:MAG: glycosyltransferase [Bacteroidales bacterium]|nr:glycosyltransferase [Bacteroidales bacterium]MCU0409091.1 glycosyltransferase [Bacteroidales bacterium]
MSKENTGSHKTVLAVTNCICFDQRVIKMASVIQDCGSEVTVAGRFRGLCCTSEILPFKSRRFRMLFKKGFLFYMFFNIRLFFFLLAGRFDVIVSNDLDTLLPSFLASRLKGIPLVFDSHEYFTGSRELMGRPLVRRFWKIIEQLILPRLEYVFTVSDSIAELYRQEYSVSPVVVRNLAPHSSSTETYSRDRIGIRTGDLLLVLQGTGINADRGAEELVDAVIETPGVSLLIVGRGDILGSLQLRVQAAGSDDKIKFVPPVVREELLKYTRMADAGVSLDKDRGINYRYSLPNKIFDYISAGVPVIASDLPEVSRIIRQYGCGILVGSVTVESVSAVLAGLVSNRGLLDGLRLKCREASLELNWEEESKKIRLVYDKVFSDC